MSIAKTSIAFAFLAAAVSLPALLGGGFGSRDGAGAPSGVENAPPPAEAPSQDATPRPARERSPDDDSTRPRRRHSPPLPYEAWPYEEETGAIPV